MYIDASRAKRNSVAFFSRFANFSARFPTLTVQNTQFEFGTQIDIGKYRMGVVILWQSVI